MKRPLLLLLGVLVGCAASPPAVQRVGIFPPGAAIVVRNIRGDIDAFAPAHGQPPDSYTIAAYTHGGPHAVAIRRGRLSLLAHALRPGVRFLVRGAKGGTMNLSTQQGSIMVADFEGVVNAHTGRGDVTMLIPQYGDASVGTGNIHVIFASTHWPGTLHFSTTHGTVTLYVNENAKAAVRLHTGNGTIYTDFPLTGTSHGHSETIASAINGGAARAIDVEVGTGSIRLMQLRPQV